LQQSIQERPCEEHYAFDDNSSLFLSFIDATYHSLLDK
jgi:hypothetical protein